MGQLRTANKRHNRTIVADRARKVAATAATVVVAKPAKPAKAAG